MKVEDWGLVEYEASVARQLDLVDKVSDGLEERLIFCTHPPVVTLGRATSAEDMTGWKGSVYESARGGRATYHGPSQVVIYPILDLKKSHMSFATRDIHAYLRALEAAVVDGLHELGLPSAESRTTEVGGISLTGVWSGDFKVASIGIAVRKWVTYHGVAINILEDASAFQGIRPCGFSTNVMASVEKLLGRPVPLNEAKAVFQRKFLHQLVENEYVP